MLGRSLAIRVDALGLAGLDTLGLVEGNAQTLCTHGRSLLVFGNAISECCTRTLRLDLVFTLVALAVGNKNDVLAVQGGDEVIPVGKLDTVVPVSLVSLFEHVFLDLLE